MCLKFSTAVRGRRRDYPQQTYAARLRCVNYVVEGKISIAHLHGKSHLTEDWRYERARTVL